MMFDLHCFENDITIVHDSWWPTDPHSNTTIGGMNMTLNVKHNIYVDLYTESF